MKALYHFVVKLEKTHHDTIELENGTVLHVDPKWKEFERRVMYGEVSVLRAAPEEEEEESAYEEVSLSDLGLDDIWRDEDRVAAGKVQ